MTTISTSIAHFILAISSLWALIQVTEFSYASIGFGLYFMTGVMGVLCYGFCHESREFYNVYSRLLYFSLTLGLPLFVSQLYVNSGFSRSIALAHFIFPLSYIFSSRHLKRFNIFVLDTLQIIYLAFLTYISFVNGYYYGLSTTASFLISFYAVGTSGMVKNTPSRDLFCYSLAFSVYFLNRTLLGY